MESQRKGVVHEVDALSLEIGSELVPDLVGPGRGLLLNTQLPEFQDFCLIFTILPLLLRVLYTVSHLLRTLEVLLAEVPPLQDCATLSIYISAYTEDLSGKCERKICFFIFFFSFHSGNSALEFSTYFVDWSDLDFFQVLADSLGDQIFNFCDHWALHNLIL